MYKTEAWIIESNFKGLRKGEVTFDALSKDEVLVKPIYGCFEGNMLHAIEKLPVDLNKQRKEEKIVIGNAGVVQIDSIGDEVDGLKAGDICIYFCNGNWDQYGYPITISGYDCKGTIGLFAKLTKVHKKNLIRIPSDSSISLQQWAAFSLRYITAWSNWKIAHKCYLSQMDVQNQEINVLAWGGGVSFAELSLAVKQGCKGYMFASMSSRLKMIKNEGIYPIDRTQFNKANFEQEVLSYVNNITDGKMASIFVDNIGGNLFNLTLKCLARQGVIATSGWKNGAILPLVRSIECINRHLFVHTHYASYDEGLDAVKFAVNNNWIPEVDSEDYEWEDILDLVNDYKTSESISYFPIYKVNDL